MAWIIPAGAGWSSYDVPPAEQLVESYSLHPAQFSAAYGSLEGYLAANGWQWDGNGPVPGTRQYADPSIPELIPGVDTAGDPTMVWNPEYESAIRVTQLVDRGITDPVEQQAALDSETQYYIDRAQSMADFNDKGQWFEDIVSTALPLAIAAMTGGALAPLGAAAAGAGAGFASGMNSSGMAGGSLGDVLMGGATGAAMGAVTGYAADGLSGLFSPTDTGLGGSYAVEGGSVDMGTGFGEGGDLWSNIQQVNPNAGMGSMGLEDGPLADWTPELLKQYGLEGSWEADQIMQAAANSQALQDSLRLSGFDMVGDMGQEAYDEMMSRVNAGGAEGFDWSRLAEFAPDIAKVLLGAFLKPDAPELTAERYTLPTEGYRTPSENTEDNILYGSKKKFGTSGINMPGSGFDTFNIGNPGLVIP